MAEANWYVVHTYSGYENKVKVDIEKTIENRNLQDQILEVSVPMQSVVEIKNGVEKAADKKMFPGYVLIHMVMNDDTWYVVRNTRGVTGFVGPARRTAQKRLERPDGALVAAGRQHGHLGLQLHPRTGGHPPAPLLQRHRPPLDPYGPRGDHRRLFAAELRQGSFCTDPCFSARR